MKSINAFIQGMSSATGALGQMVIAIMAITIVYDVTMRYLFAAPTFWALEINTFLLAFICTVPAADVLKANAHIRITFLTDALSPRMRGRFSIVRAGAGIALCAVMTWSGGMMAWQAWQYNDRVSSTLGTPLVIPYLFLPVGFILLGLQYTQMLRNSEPHAAPPTTM